jgi:hypothetical protein
MKFKTRYGELDTDNLPKEPYVLGYSYNDKGEITWQHVYIPLQLVEKNKYS